MFDVHHKVRNEYVITKYDNFDSAFNYAALAYTNLIQVLQHGTYIVFVKPNISVVRYNIRRRGQATVWDIETGILEYEDDDNPPTETFQCVITVGPGTP